MNRHIPFVARELRVIGVTPGVFGGPDRPLRDTPVSARENMAAMYFEKHPYWLPMPGESTMIVPALYNNLLGRGGPSGTTDAFGIEWEWVESAGGSIVRPGAPFLSDANEWRDKIKIPDIDAWDWAGAAEDTPCDPRVATQATLINGFWFERLVSFMDFAPAAIALIDEDQRDAVKSLFEAMTDLALRVVDKFCEYWPSLNGFNVHDDWGSQRSPFFSQEVADELFVPYMKELTDHIHKKGRYATLHSCGCCETRISSFIAGGFDGWDPQAMNDTRKLYDEVGDQIVISVVPDPFDPETVGEDEQRRRGREFAELFCRPGKPAQLGFYGGAMLTPAFTEEVYVSSRHLFGA